MGMGIRVGMRPGPHCWSGMYRCAAIDSAHIHTKHTKHTHGRSAHTGACSIPSSSHAPFPLSVNVWQVGVRSNDELFRIFQGGAGEMDTLLDQYFMDATTRTILTKKGLLTDSIRRAAPGACRKGEGEEGV